MCYWPTLTELYSAWLYVRPAQDLTNELTWKYVFYHHLVIRSACTINALFARVIHGKIDTKLLPCWNIILIHVSDTVPVRRSDTVYLNLQCLPSSIVEHHLANGGYYTQPFLFYAFQLLIWTSTRCDLHIFDIRARPVSQPVTCLKIDI